MRLVAGRTVALWGTNQQNDVVSFACVFRDLAYCSQSLNHGPLGSQMSKVPAIHFDGADFLAGQRFEFSAGLF
jgi:hypothetical protein